MLNKVMLMGRLVRDPELRHTQSNTPVTSFRLAVDRRFARAAADGTRPQQTADFFDIVAWDKNAEFASKWFAKGQLVAVCGRLQQREWKDKDGNARVSVEVVAEELHFAEKKGASTGGSPAPFSGGGFDAPAPVAPSSEFSELDDDDGELPF